MDYKELAEMCRYLSDTPSYTAFNDEVEREVICDSCKGELCYEKVKDAHWCMYEALQRAATAITALLARAEAAEKKSADVRPAVRGRWLYETEIEGHACGECSACHKIRVIDNFCPNCGADMRGGDEQ